MPALRAAPAAALELTLTRVRVEDERDPGNAVVWCPAWQLAAAPRPFVRLLGLTSRSWPRRPGEDPILPNHIVPAAELDFDPPAQCDLRTFKIITAYASQSVVLSRSRRTAGGSRITASPLFTSSGGEERVLAAARVPEHALGEADRLFARPQEAAEIPLIRSGKECWNDWHTPNATPHDGWMKEAHPLVQKALERVQSPTSLRRMLRDPLGFVWRYALRWQSPSERERPLSLPKDEFGRLVHELLRRTIDRLEPSPGFIAARPEAIEAALAASVMEVTESWPLRWPVPPHVLWIYTVAQAASLSLKGLTLETFTEQGSRSWTEVPFGQEDRDHRTLPWNPKLPVKIPDSSIRIQGSIDRVDLRSDRKVRVTDYKTGDPPAEIDEVVIDGGKELQRVLYALASRELLSDPPAIVARLIYLQGKPQIAPLRNQDHVFGMVSSFVNAACVVLNSGRTVSGIDAWSQEDDPGAIQRARYDLSFALPASPGYFRRKIPNFRSTVRELPKFWGIR
jgi:RecB family exonuclease